jgi:hypothetical protein
VMPYPNWTTEESPALESQSDTYPAEWGGKVPKVVRLTRVVPVDGEVFMWNVTSTRVPGPGEYPAWVNSHGAVAMIRPDGSSFGLRPNEFEVVEWWTP